MDQILYRNRSKPSVFPEASVNRSWNPVSQVIDELTNRMVSMLVDADVFSGKAGPLYVWRYTMTMLQNYGIADVWDYVEIEHLSIALIRRINSDGMLEDVSKYTPIFDRLRRNLPSLIILFKQEELSAQMNFEAMLEKTSASEFLFTIIKNSDAIFKTSKSIKRCIGSFLVHVIDLEKQEYQKILSKPMLYLDQSIGTSKSELFGYSNANANGDLDSIISLINESVQNFQEIETSNERWSLSPWMFGIAFMRYAQSQTAIWNSFHPDIKAKWSQVSIKHLASAQKRINESNFKLCVLQGILPTALEYEHLSISKDKEILRIIYCIPQIISWNRCIDKQALLDLTYEKNIRRVVELSKQEIKRVMGDEIKDIEQIMNEPEVYIQGKFNTIQKTLISNLFANIKSEFYKAFMQPAHVMHVTLPLMICIFVESEFLSFAKAHTPRSATSLVKYLLYGLFPLLYSIALDTQTRVISSVTLHSKHLK